MSAATTFDELDHAVPVLDAASAVSAAAAVSAELAVGAAERDALRILPVEQLAVLSASGLLGITVPCEYGGADLPAGAVAEVFRLLAIGDPNVAQIPHSHFVYVNAMRHRGTRSQQAFFFGEALEGRRFGNAQSEVGTKHVRDYRTTLRPAGEDLWRLDGDKGYSTGALFADWIPVLAHLGEDGPMHVAWVDRRADGVTVVDDWDGMGQRTTASGSVQLRNVAVHTSRITPYHHTFEGPQTYGAFAQLLHAAIDAGIARAALDEAAAFVTTKSRRYPDAGVRHSLRAGLAEPRPPLAQRTHAHPARPRVVEGSAPRAVRRRRDAAPQPRPAVIPVIELVETRKTKGNPC
ncbi:hypothetical protein GCM10023350_20780 [Nocardioides endophyticus]|uniref:SfnB family sulfur acquisition oxidoreductase n=1 Tax=Nocardioides endophyticus TaxID=1353775 RepID=A0ABP8YSZ6_9ACTN